MLVNLPAECQLRLRFGRRLTNCPVSQLVVRWGCLLPTICELVESLVACSYLGVEYQCRL